MADASGIRVNWQNVSQADYLANNAKARNNVINAEAMNEIGSVLRSVNVEVENNTSGLSSLAATVQNLIDNPPAPGPGGDYAPLAGSVRFVSGGSSVARGTAATNVCVIFLVPGAVAPVNAVSGLDVWMRTV